MKLKSEKDTPPDGPFAGTLLLRAMYERSPAPGAVWPQALRNSWLATMAVVFDTIYPTVPVRGRKPKKAAVAKVKEAGS